MLKNEILQITDKLPIVDSPEITRRPYGEGSMFEGALNESTVVRITKERLPYNHHKEPITILNLSAVGSKRGIEEVVKDVSNVFGKPLGRGNNEKLPWLHHVIWEAPQEITSQTQPK